MSREILQDIISDFSPNKFTRFFRAKNRSFSPRQEPFSQYDDPSFADGMKFGEITFPEGEKLIACAFKSTRPLSERSSRKAQYENGKKILMETNSDAGIFIFYDSRGNFRFSLIYPEAAGTRRQWNNFRRFTYFVSREPGVTNKTFLVRVGDGDFSSLKKIKDAFSVEKVTKEFYEQYRKLFEALVVDLDSNQTFRNEASRGRINTPDFAKKLLGQIVFLYFLQKKGWLGVPQNKPWGEGDKNFISNLYRRAVTNKENFFNDYLEVLFYDTLNNANREGADPSFSKYFDCRIPFLNGGLFEPEYDWHGTTIHLDNGVFKNIFEVFDRYNFTVEEESPDDKEVAVDPEMLGKVFENLLEENLRKGKGTYYTPREIVHYMCRESLVNFLVSQSGLEEEGIRALILRHESGFAADEAKTLERLLKDVKVCDPACGSGAFLVGMLNEIIHARLALDPAGSEYALKKETIHNCVYGVDIDPGAVEIAKLRLWLSLVVDYELADIEPLPNLDYKIMCGNSLLEELIVGDESIPLFDPDVLTKDRPKRKSSDKLMQMDFLKQDADEYLKILRKLHVEYFHETDTQKKKIVRGRIEKIEMDFIQSSINKRVKELDEHIRNLNMQKPEDRKKNAVLLKKKLEYMSIPNDIRKSKVRPYFLWHLNFFEVFQEKGGFDVVIANPPYGIPNKKQNKSIGHLMFEQHLNNIKRMQLFRVAMGGMINMYRLFIVKGTDVLRPSGTMCQIFPLAFVGDISAKNLREWVLNNLKVIGLEAFPERDNERKRVFEAVKMSVCILTIEKINQNGDFYLRINSDRYVDTTEPKTILNNKLIGTIDKEFLCIPLLLKDDVEIISKLISKGQKMGSVSKCFTGEVDLTLDKGYLSDRKKDAKLIKGAQIDRYLLKDKMSQGEIKYLNSKKYLQENKGARSKHHLQKRIIMQGITGVNEKTRLKMTILAEGNFCANSVNYILEDEHKKYDLRYLLAIMNSRLLNWYFKKKSSNSNVNGYEVDDLPVVCLEKSKQELFIEITGKILTVIQNDGYLTNSTAQTKVKEYERQIDQMVYKLYGLTEEEIKIVEDGAGQTKRRTCT